MSPTACGGRSKFTKFALQQREFLMLMNFKEKKHHKKLFNSSWQQKFKSLICHPCSLVECIFSFFLFQQIKKISLTLIPLSGTSGLCRSEATNTWTIRIPQRTRIFKADNCLNVRNVHFKLVMQFNLVMPSHISVEWKIVHFYFGTRRYSVSLRENLSIFHDI